MFRMLDMNFHEIPRMECEDYESICKMASVYSKRSENHNAMMVMIVDHNNEYIYSIFNDGIRYDGHIKPSPQTEETPEVSSVKYDDLENIINFKEFALSRDMQIKYELNNKIWSVEVGAYWKTTGATLQEAMQDMFKYFPIKGV